MSSNTTIGLPRRCGWRNSKTAHTTVRQFTPSLEAKYSASVVVEAAHLRVLDFRHTPTSPDITAAPDTNSLSLAFLSYSASTYTNTHGSWLRVNVRPHPFVLRRFKRISSKAFKCSSPGLWLWSATARTDSRCPAVSRWQATEGFQPPPDRSIFLRNHLPSLNLAQSLMD